MNIDADTWNDWFPIGTPVTYWRGQRDESAGIRSITRSKAWTLGCGDPVVAVEGRAGGIYLTHIEPETSAVS